MRISIESHARRKLWRLDRYTPASNAATSPEPRWLSTVPESGGSIGWYRNDGDSSNHVCITTSGIIALFEGVRRYVPYAEMLRVIREDKKNVEDDNVWLQLRSQHRLALVIHGRDLQCGTHDKYSVMMFLESTIAEVHE